MKLTLYLLAGSALILPGIIYLVINSDLNTFNLLALTEPGLFTENQQRFVFFLFYIGFGILAGVWPFHTWSPVGHVAAPTAVSMIHAGVLMKIGAFGVLRLGMTLCPLGWQFWAPLMAFLATVGIVYGAFVGLSQTDVKYVIGYSSVSHMGIVGLGLATMSADGLNGAVFQMFAHGLMTALFFSSLGYIYDKTHTKAIAELGGLLKTMPVATGYLIVAALTGIGVPCLASFWAELMVFISAFKVYPVYGTLAICGLAVTALFILRVIQKVCYGPPQERFADLPDVSLGLGAPRIILISAIVLFGLFPSLMFDMIQTATIPFLDRLP
jgi:NADH-quinone oxidoreductase subunit M